MIKDSKKVGVYKYNAYGEKFEIIEQINGRYVNVKFDNGFVKTVAYSQFYSGTIKNPYTKSLYNIGYLGEGEYKTSENGIQTKEYKVWSSMFCRCYNPKLHVTHPSYIGCTVSEDWHNFQNFAKWFSENYYEIKGETICLDKDILVKGNKIYSSNTCIFTPETINSLFTKCNKKRGNLPIGVVYNKKNNNYISTYNYNSMNIYLGLYNTPEEAFSVYKKAKEEHIKEVANTYKNKYPQFPEKLYNAMMNYSVEITD